MKNVIRLLAKIDLFPLGLIAAGTTADSGMNKKLSGPGTKTLTISNDEMEEIMKTVKFLEDFGLLLKEFGKKFQIKRKNKNINFLVCY